jgi:hypothetical protein
MKVVNILMLILFLGKLAITNILKNMLCISWIHRYCHGYASEHQVLFQSQGKTAAETYKMFETVYGKSSRLYISSNCLTTSKQDVKTLKMIQEVSGCPLPKIWKQLQKFVNWWPENII